MPRGQRSKPVEPVEEQDTAQIDGPIEVEDLDEVENVVEAAPPPAKQTSGVEITFKGLKVDGRAPAFVTLIVPDDGTAPDDPTASISDGQTFTFAIGKPARVPAEAAAWLARHPVFDIG
jgi:hypothetical protein